MKTKDLRKKNIGELEAEIEDKRKALSDLRFGNTGNKTKNVKQSKNLRRDIAKIMTLINEAKK